MTFNVQHPAWSIGLFFSRFTSYNNPINVVILIFQRPNQRFKERTLQPDLPRSSIRCYPLIFDRTPIQILGVQFNSLSYLENIGGWSAPERCAGIFIHNLEYFLYELQRTSCGKVVIELTKTILILSIIRDPMRLMNGELKPVYTYHAHGFHLRAMTSA